MTVGKLYVCNDCGEEFAVLGEPLEIKCLKCGSKNVEEKT